MNSIIRTKRPLKLSQMNITINGKHALLFDDDATSSFINSEEALVEWNSLLIDRYDVRHLLSGPPPSRRRRNPQTSHSSSADVEIDHERYLDLPSHEEEEEAEKEEEDAKPESVGGFKAVPFSYGNYEDSSDQKIAEAESEIPEFRPPFSVPESLVQNLPPTEKVHQIIARTALFVSKNGGQSEIILRVKQGDNPTFGFLMPDHHLHPYFRFLVDHHELTQSKDDRQTENEEKTSNTGALSLLGSVYGTGEDDDIGTEHAPSSSRERVSENNVDADATMLSICKHETILKHSVPLIKRNSISTAIKPVRTSSLKKDESTSSVSDVPDKLRAASLPPIPRTEQILVDPSLEMKRLVDKIVEFIIKNGRQFETVLMAQDRGHGRFPFLIPSNIFHPYYLKVLQKAQESKLTVKSFHHDKEDSRGHILNKKLKENEKSLAEPDDTLIGSERKDKFKMVINKSKKEGSDVSAKPTQEPPEVQVDAAQAAAILQAATRGIKHPNLENLFGQPSNEAASSDTHLTHEQNLKAERLKRAKMFVAQLKSGAVPSKTQPSHGLSAEPQGLEADNRLAAKERERSTTPLDFHNTDKIVKSEKDHLSEEKRAKRKYRPRRDEEGDSSVALEEVDDDVADERERKRSRRHRTEKHHSRDDEHAKRRHRSHRSSRKHHDVVDESDEEKHHKHSMNKKHRSPSSSEDDEESDHKYSRKKHRSHRSEDINDEVDSDHKYSRKKRSHRSHESSHHSSDKHKHRNSHSSRHRRKVDVSSEEELRDHDEANKHKQGFDSEREELEEGEISSKLSGQSREDPLANDASREPSVDVSSQDRRPSIQPMETTEVPDELRAKVRAMLSTL